MTQGTAIKIGDAVAWADVPDGAMVRTGRRKQPNQHVVRIAGHGRYVSGEWGWRPWEQRWTWACEAEAFERCRGSDPTIIALGLTGSESAEDLQRMAEIFDGWRDLCERTGWDREMAWGNAVALHGFGWRAGLPFVASKFVRATEGLADMAETLAQQRLHVEIELARRAR